MIKRFLKNKSGNFATMVAFASLPIMLGIGAAVDYSGVAREETRLQNALDSAILAVGIDFPSMSNVKVQQIIKDYLQSNMEPSEYTNIKNLSVKQDIKGRTLTATANGEFKTNFMMLAGINTFGYDAESQIKAASGGAEIALVLDNTGSMNLDGKLNALKTSATNFTNAMMTKATGGDIKIGIVPFAAYVNVGLANRNASWIDVPADSSTTDPNFCYMTSDVIPGSCTTQTATNAEGQTYKTSQCQYGAAYEVCGPRTTSETWLGCVGSRDYPYNLEDRSYTSRPVPGVMNISCGQEITSLTDTRQTVLDKITAMTGNGNTYIPTGLTWGMRLLSNDTPYSEAVTALTAKNKDIKKYLILMTDGDNTASAEVPTKPTHWGSDVAQSNTWTTEVCQNIKDEDITVFTITFGTVLPDTANLIKGCASNAANYFHAVDGSELSAAFEGIRQQIAALHLSK